MSISPIIVRLDTKDKIVDFRNGLVPAREEDYAMVHGVGGKDHAPNSVIKICICDYSAGKGNASKTVDANVSPFVVDQIYEVCKKNAGLTADAAAPNGESGLDSALAQTRALAESLRKLDKDAFKAAVELGKALAAQKGKGDTVGFNYVQDKVDVYHEANGKAPVSRLIITRQARRPDGTVSKSPWLIKVTNGIAPIVKQAKGTCSFVAREMSDVVEAYIYISDNEMYKAAYRITHFINIWECTNVALVKRGLAQAAAERESFRK